MQEFSALIELLMMLITDPRTSVLFALLAVAAVIDFRTYKIPNWLTVPGAIFGLAYAIAVPFSREHGFQWALGGLALGLVIPLPLYALRVMGAGDVKLFAMAGAFLGVSDIPYALIWSFIAGGATALVFAVFKGALGRVLGNIRNVAQVTMLSVMGNMRPQVHVSAAESVGKIPYGVSICIGTVGYVVAKQLGYM